MKEGRNIGQDYYDELLERICDIRASEKRLYKKIFDLYALSVQDLSLQPHSIDG